MDMWFTEVEAFQQQEMEGREGTASSAAVYTILE